MQTLTDFQLNEIAAKVADRLREGANAATPGAPVATVRELPKNVDGNPEFSNVILTLDHLQDAHPGDGHIRNKMVFSTESTVEVLAKLIDYYGIRMTSTGLARVMEIAGAAAQSEYNGGILVLYVGGGNPHEIGNDRGPIVEVILSTVTYDALVRHPDFGKDSSLLASDALVRAVQAALKAQEIAPGVYPPLTYLQITEASFEGTAEVRPAPAPDAPNSTTGGQDFHDARNFASAGQDVT